MDSELPLLAEPPVSPYDRCCQTANDRNLNRRSIPSLKEYMLVSQREPHVEHGVHSSETFDLQGAVYLSAIDSTLALADAYARVFSRHLPE